MAITKMSYKNEVGTTEYYYSASDDDFLYFMATIAPTETIAKAVRRFFEIPDKYMVRDIEFHKDTDPMCVEVICVLDVGRNSPFIKSLISRK